MGKDTLEKCYSTLMQVAMNCSYCIAILLTKDIPTVPGSLWVWVPPMSTNIRVLCYPLNCRRDTLETSSAQAMTVYVRTAGRCCLYRAVVRFDTPIRWLLYSLLSSQ